MRHAVILAGGSGTRLWPASRRVRPKQLLPIGPGGKTLLSIAVERGRAIAEHVLIVTAASQVEATKREAPGVEVIAEPVGRNTAPAIGLAAATLARRDNAAVLAILPADQWVRDEKVLAQAFDVGLSEVEKSDAIGTIGITPTRPETGFGYLEVDAIAPNTVSVVKRFVEKPDRARAESFLASGNYLWNAGIFVASAKRILAELEVHAPPIAQAMQDITAGKVAIEAVYPTLPSISFDHAVMERVTRVVTVPAIGAGWDDVGSWAALPAIIGTDANGNAIAGDAIVDGRGNIVFSDNTFVAIVGVDDLVVVKSGDAILVMRKDAAQDVRKVVEALSAQGKERYL